MKVAYTGTSDFQKFSKADFAKAGIEDGKNHSFARGEPTEVNDEIGEALVAKDGIFGDFSFVSLEEVEEGDTNEQTEEAQRKAADKAAKRAAKKAASSSDSQGASTGPGSSTSGTASPGSTP